MGSSKNDFGTWHASSAARLDVDPIVARDTLVECFLKAQKETFERTKNNLGVATDDEALRKSARGAVRTAMRGVGGDYDEPTIDDLHDAMEVLGSKARAWGTPEDVINRHMSEMNKVLVRAHG